MAQEFAITVSVGIMLGLLHVVYSLFMRIKSLEKSCKLLREGIDNNVSENSELNEALKRKNNYVLNYAAIVAKQASYINDLIAMNESVCDEYDKYIVEMEHDIYKMSYSLNVLKCDENNKLAIINYYKGQWVNESENNLKLRTAMEDMQQVNKALLLSIERRDQKLKTLEVTKIMLNHLYGKFGVKSNEQN